ncbi:DNA alkylation repair protein [Streptomyces sp. ODS05-4]|uniref:DNA alkylation repair protein n=1 Tax=Streptomyces sp. ODS05-4 TaxID=2944939 RepID=UPI00210AAFC4|nr:DNA alkylation repair protein [Streptomyces sp. ODS05-4]
MDARVLEGLNQGVRQAATLAEALAVDFGILLSRVAPEAARGRDDRLPGGITRRMAQTARLLLEHRGPGVFHQLAAHPSDTVRGWAAYVLAATPDLDLALRFDRIRPLAEDPHFTVREWAWLALREHVAADLGPATELLTPWSREPSPSLRRFAVEITRPRGVWARHIRELTDHPERGLPVIDPLRADTSRYVQDSVANWLNDAAKTRPEWVRDTCARWLAAHPDSADTRRICRRAQRSLPRPAVAGA